jgi:hypothetical protein
MKLLLSFMSATLAMSVLCGACQADEKREEKPRFKGVELYSWKDNGGDWMFAMVSGTNRLKTEKEVKAAPNQFKGDGDLKKALARLAVGELVIWIHRIEGFQYPPEATRKEIEKAAKDAKVRLEIATKQ